MVDTHNAKVYSRIKLTTGIVSSVISFVLMLAIVVTGFSAGVESWLRGFASNDYLVLLLFALCIGAIEAVFTFPLGFYSSYIVEHRFHLSNQTLVRWAWERTKGMLVGVPLMVPLVLIFYYCLQTYGEQWWLPVSIVLTIFSVVLARLAPVLIMPLFYKFTPLEHPGLKQRITELCAAADVRIDGIFSFDMSRNTKKANAGFTGIGRAKRIILGDTLLKDFTEDEISTVFAHELGHYKHRHIMIGMMIGVVSTFAGLFIAAELYSRSIGLFGFSATTEIAALPLLGLWLSLFGLATSVAGNLLSRKHEREADAYAVATTSNAPAFISALRKLESTNLADPEPHPLVEFFFYSHPSIARRVKLIEAMGTA